jgi:energy-coupling factor transporter transmembrane protein EcfT
LAETSTLRRVDPRVKLVVCLCVSLAVMLSLEKLVVAMAAYVALLLWAGLLPEAGRQVWRLKWVLVVLFTVDWLLVSLDLAIIVTLRLVLLAGVFVLFVCTTTPYELRLALERLKVPHRYALSLSLAFQSVDLIGDEWRAIVEAQRARGAWLVGGEGSTSGNGFFRGRRWREILAAVRSMVALTVPVIVLTTRRAWTMTEAAYARGFGSPHRRSYRQLRLEWLDWLLMVGTAAVGIGLLLWR